MKNLTKVRIKEFVEMTDREMKLTVGGVDASSSSSSSSSSSGSEATEACKGKKEYDDCTKSGQRGCCAYAPFVYSLYCRVPC